ncbi:MAG: HAD family hydrolase [Candidatus Paceibacterota bacterium]
MPPQEGFNKEHDNKDLTPKQETSPEVEDEETKQIRETREVVGDSSIWKKAIEQKGFSAVKELAERIGVPDYSKYYTYQAEANGNLDLNEGLSSRLLDAQTPEEKYKNLIEVLVDELIKLEKPKYTSEDADTPDMIGKRTEWNHRACHLIEGYPRRSSLLTYPETHEAAKKIANEGVKLAVEDEESLNVSRMVLPMMKWNMDRLSMEDIDKPFMLHPDSPFNESYNEKFKDGVGAFLTSKTPREFVEKVVRVVSDHPFLIFGDEESDGLKKFLEILAKCNIEKEVVKDYFSKNFSLGDQPNVSPESLLENIKASETAQEVEPGNFVDVDGTLIINGRINDPLLQRLQELVQKGEKVVIFTGGNPEQATSQLRRLGVPENFFPVVSKSGFRGKILGQLFDDTPAQFQGFKARKEGYIGK